METRQSRSSATVTRGKSLGARVADYRRNAGYRSRSAFCSDGGPATLTVRMLEAIETDAREPTISELLEISHVLKAPLPALVADLTQPFADAVIGRPSSPLRHLSNADLVALVQGDLHLENLRTVELLNAITAHREASSWEEAAVAEVKHTAGTNEAQESRVLASRRDAASAGRWKAYWRRQIQKLIHRDGLEP